PRRRKQTRESAGARRGNLGRAAVPGEYNQGLMSRRFTFVTLVLTAVVAFLVGAIVAGGAGGGGGGGGGVAAGGAGARRAAAVRPAARAASTLPAPGALVNFADVVERINPAVVNIDTTTRGSDRRRRGRSTPGSDPFDGPFDFGGPRDRENSPRRGSGSGF